MSFGEEVRDEVAHLPLADGCGVALLAGAFRGAGSLHLTGRGHVHGELDVAGHAVARALLQAVRAEGVECEIRRYEPARLGRGTRFRLVVEGDDAGRTLLTEIGLLDDSGRPRPLPARTVIRRGACRCAYLRGAFMVAGSVSAPERPALLEIRCPDRPAADEIERVAAREGHVLRVRERPRHWEVSTRRRETVAGLLLTIGAEAAALRCEEAEVLLVTREAANRRANFDTANLRKQVAATRRQLAAIAALREEGRLPDLSPALREAAGLRERAPDLTLAELAAEAGMARATLAARLRRVTALGEDRDPSRRESL